MMLITRTIIVAAATCALSAVSPVLASAQKGAPNSLEFVVLNGPMAGTYKAPAADIMCVYMKSDHSFFATYKNFETTGPDKLDGGGIKIVNSDDAGPKWGQVEVNFRGKTSYLVSAGPTPNGPFTMSKTGSKGEIAFQGKTKEGIQLKVNAKCGVIESL